MAEKTVNAPIRIARVGQSVTEVDMGDNALTVGEALTATGMADTKDLNIHVNGVPVDKKHRLEPGDAVVLVPKIRGGS